MECQKMKFEIDAIFKWMPTYIFRERERGIVSTADGVSRGDDGATSLQRRHDAGLRDRDALLLHGFVDTRPIRLVHLGTRTTQGHSNVSVLTGSTHC